MNDEDAIESLKRGLLSQINGSGTVDYHDRIIQAQLDALAADGYTVVKTETLAPDYNPVLNPEAIGDPNATPRVFVGAGLRRLLRPCACGGVNGFHRDDWKP